MTLCKKLSMQYVFCCMMTRHASSGYNLTRMLDLTGCHLKKVSRTWRLFLFFVLLIVFQEGIFEYQFYIKKLPYISIVVLLIFWNPMILSAYVYPYTVNYIPFNLFLLLIRNIHTFAHKPSVRKYMYKCVVIQ